MIKEREHLLEKISIIAQTFFCLISYGASVWIYRFIIGQPFQFTDEEKLVGLIIIPLWYVLLDLMKLGRILRARSYISLLRDYIWVEIIGIIALYTSIKLLSIKSVSEEEIFLFAIINLFVLYCSTIIYYTAFRIVRRKGYNTRELLIFADEQSESIIQHIEDTQDWGYKICGIVTDSPKLIAVFGKQLPIVPTNIDIDNYLVKNTVDEVLYCKGEANQDEIKRIALACREIGVVFYLQSVLHAFKELNLHFTLKNQLPLFAHKNIPTNYIALKVKYGFDFIFSLVVTIILSPVFLLIAIAIKLDDNGPVFFVQERVGLNGRRFKCLKFRTMVADAETLKLQLLSQNEQEGPVFKIKNDPRITRMGNFLRKTSLDELPQFFNVLTGEMSVVGPRPPIPSEVEQYKRWQNRRLSMKPGITCIWQVSGRNNIPFEQWMKMDLQYIDNWSIKLDIILILKTVKTMLTGSGQ